MYSSSWLQRSWWARRRARPPSTGCGTSGRRRSRSWRRSWTRRRSARSGRGGGTSAGARWRGGGSRRWSGGGRSRSTRRITSATHRVSVRWGLPCLIFVWDISTFVKNGSHFRVESHNLGIKFYSLISIGCVIFRYWINLCYCHWIGYQIKCFISNVWETSLI